jgi:hypothetical protein
LIGLLSVSDTDTTVVAAGMTGGKKGRVISKKNPDFARNAVVIKSTLETLNFSQTSAIRTAVVMIAVVAGMRFISFAGRRLLSSVRNWSNLCFDAVRLVTIKKFRSIG